MALDVISKISLDLKAPNAEIVYGNQYDTVGYVQAKLLNGGEKWEVPVGAIGVISYFKSDKIGGYYDTTSGNKTAVSVTTDRSVVTIALDQQTLTTIGNVSVQVNFYQNNQRLSTFTFILHVQASPITELNVDSKWFGRLLLLSGLIPDYTLSLDGAAAEASTTGARIATLSSGVESLENLKVNKPTTSPDGTNGQLLRTLGDGRTEWANAGAPTSEQVAAAVDDWLDNHPEATTTVLDNSLSIKKMQTGTLGYVTPESYGAVGDGITDDSNAFYSCLNSGERVYIPAKQYLVGDVVFGNNCTVIGDDGVYTDKKPLYKKKWFLDFRNFYKTGEIPYPVGTTYEEGIVYDSAIEKYVVSMYVHGNESDSTTLLVVNPSTLSIETTYDYAISTANAISYNPYTNKIIVSCFGTNHGAHIINGSTFEYEGTFTYPADIIDSGTVPYYVFFDKVTKTYAIVPHNSSISTYPIKIYDEEFTLLKTTSVNLGEPLVIQSSEYFDGKLYKPSWDCVLEIDVNTGDFRRIDNAGYFEIEDCCFDGDGVMHIIGHSANSGSAELYSYSDSYIQKSNLYDRYNHTIYLLNKDLNEVTGDGEYYVEITDTESEINYHNPDSLTKATLIVKSAAKDGTQIEGCFQLFMSGLGTRRGLYVRQYVNSTKAWTEWRPLLARTIGKKHTHNSNVINASNVNSTVEGDFVTLNGWLRISTDSVASHSQLFTDLRKPIDDVYVAMFDENNNTMTMGYISRNNTIMETSTYPFNEKSGHVLTIIPCTYFTNEKVYDNP